MSCILFCIIKSCCLLNIHIIVAFQWYLSHSYHAHYFALLYISNFYHDYLLFWIIFFYQQQASSSATQEGAKKRNKGASKKAKTSEPSQEMSLSCQIHSCYIRHQCQKNCSCYMTSLLSCPTPDFGQPWHSLKHASVHLNLNNVLADLVITRHFKCMQYNFEISTVWAGLNNCHSSLATKITMSTVVCWFLFCF